MASFEEFMTEHPGVLADEVVPAEDDRAAEKNSGRAGEKVGNRAGEKVGNRAGDKGGNRMRVVVWTDGSSRGNPGPGGYGAVLLYTDASGVEHRRELSQGYRETTNNRMELMAVIAALEALRRPCEVEVHSDSQYVVNAFNKGWVWGWLKKGWKTASKQPVKNPDLWKRLLAAKRPHDVTFVWVKGHAGTDLNERCDELATTAADDRAHLIEDEGFSPQGLF